MEFTIYRDSWRRGGGGRDHADGPTALLNSQGKMCCLGQCAIQLGAKPQDIFGAGEPTDVNDLWPFEGVLAIHEEPEEDDQDTSAYSEWCATQLTADAMPINDDPTLSDRERETKLTALFEQEQGHQLHFVDGPAPWVIDIF